MANKAYRFPKEGGDENTWAQYALAMERANIGINTCKLYNDAGTLKLSKGRIGIDDGTQPSICEIDTITSIPLSGTTSIWQEVYMTVSATAVDFDTVDMAGADNILEVPTTFSALYDEEKEGYYRNPARRCIGIVWVDSGGNLVGIINTRSGIEGYVSNTMEFSLGGSTLSYVSHVRYHDTNLSHLTYKDTNVTENELFDLLDNFIPNDGDCLAISCTAYAVTLAAAEQHFTGTIAEREDSNTINIYGVVTDDGVPDVSLLTISADNGTGTVINSWVSCTVYLSF